MSAIVVHKNALPVSVFRRLVRAVLRIGEERLAEGYTTNFWYGFDAMPGNLAEEVIMQLLPLVRPGARCIGAEWWLGRLRYGESLPLHFDRDLSLEAQRGEIVYPLWSSILYLNRYPSSPTVILERTPENGAPPAGGKAVYPAPNHYAIYRGDLQHGVLARRSARKPPGIRLTFLVNFWDRRPLPPVCRDYDGTVYSALHSA